MKLIKPFVFAVVWLLAAAVSVNPAVAQLRIRGYAEPAYSVRYGDAGPIDDRNTLNETRIMLENQWYGGQGEVLDLRFLAKPAAAGAEVEDEFEVRQASVLYPATRDLDVIAGRQAIDWGPAQYEFVNDHFPKDYRSFFLGRDLEYMRAPADALRLRWFSDYGNLDLIAMPEFEPNRNPEGEVIPVHFDGELLDQEEVLEKTGDKPPRRLPSSSPEDGEVHARWSENYGRWEVALYGYRGFMGNPAGFNADGTDNFVYHPEMASGGASLRGPFMGGIAWLETSFDDIRHDEAGESEGLPSDVYNLLVGYEFDHTPTVTYMFQVHWLHNYDSKGLREDIDEENHPYEKRNRYRLQLATERSYMSDRLTLRARGFAGLQVQDWHLRLEADYEWSDNIRVYAGSLHYDADNEASRFGALQDHDAFYSRLRYSF